MLGTSLFPSLESGVILDGFHSEGMLEVLIQLFKIWANISEMAGAASLTSLVLKFCSPMDSWAGSYFIIFSTLTLVVDCILSNVSPLIFGNRFPGPD